MKYLWAAVAMTVALGAFVGGTEWYVRRTTKRVYGFTHSLWWS